MCGARDPGIDEWRESVAALCDKLRAAGTLTFAEMATVLNKHGLRTRKGVFWTGQSLYICCREVRRRHAGKKITSRESHELVDGRWRDGMRSKILELRTYGVTRYDDIADSLNKEGVTTRLGRPWSLQSVYRLMRAIGMSAGKPGRRGRDE